MVPVVTAGVVPLAINDGHRAALEIITPGDDMRPGHHTKIFGLADTDKAHEIFEIISVPTLGQFVFEIGKPLKFGRHLGEHLKFFTRE